MIGVIILVICCWGCAALFLGIGACACKRKTPIHFWAGTQIDPQTVSDIPAYNLANGKMWMMYSVPYWLSGVFALFCGRAHWCAIVALIMMILACVPGIPLLVFRYRQIEATFLKQGR